MFHLTKLKTHRHKRQITLPQVRQISAEQDAEGQRGGRSLVRVVRTCGKLVGLLLKNVPVHRKLGPSRKGADVKISLPLF